MLADGLEKDGFVGVVGDGLTDAGLDKGERFLDGRGFFRLVSEGFAADLAEDADAKGRGIFGADFTEDNARGLSLYFFKIFGEGKTVGIVGADDALRVGRATFEGLVVMPDALVFK